jgi:hypothetical protein
MKVQQHSSSLEAKHCCNIRNSFSSMQAQQFGAGRLGHPAQTSMLTYLYNPTCQHAGIGGCPDCVVDMLASH